MAVIVVVPAEELAAEAAGVLDGVEPLGKDRPVLQRLELRLAVGVVVRGLRSRMRLRDVQVGEHFGDGLALHRRSPVGVQVESTIVEVFTGRMFVAARCRAGDADHGWITVSLIRSRDLCP